jgi:hypothetical protein
VLFDPDGMGWFHSVGVVCVFKDLPASDTFRMLSRLSIFIVPHRRRRSRVPSITAASW